MFEGLHLFSSPIAAHRCSVFCMHVESRLPKIKPGASLKGWSGVAFSFKQTDIIYTNSYRNSDHIFKPEPTKMSVTEGEENCKRQRRAGLLLKILVQLFKRKPEICATKCLTVKNRHGGCGRRNGSGISRKWTPWPPGSTQERTAVSPGRPNVQKR